MAKKTLLVLLSVVLLSAGWLGLSGLTLLVALVPLLMISSGYGASARDFWRMTGWAALTFVLWNVATIWWVWIATPIGPITATIVSTFWNLVAFMLFHYVSKRASKALSYTLLVAAWVATEFLYTSAEVMSFPWLTLGNGFSGDIWAVQWYEWTGVMGGSVWVLLVNIAIFEAWRNRNAAKICVAAATLIVPIVVSLFLYFGWQPSEEKVTTSVIQPNVDCYDEKFADNKDWQIENIVDLMRQVPSDAMLVVLPETAVPETLNDDIPWSSKSTAEMRSVLDSLYPKAMAITGATTVKYYVDENERTETARNRGGFYYDVFNSAVALNPGMGGGVHHKMRLVIGVETMPFTGLLNKFVDLGGITGQLGRNDIAIPFIKKDYIAGPAICYEGLYGDCFARFIRHGAQIMTVLSNDGWWGNTSGHKRLFDFCRLRAIETRRGVARSANTGVSGFINSRGDVLERMDWEERGVLTYDMEIRNDVTLYVRYGDWIGRLGLFLTFLGVMYFTAYRIRRRNHLAD